MEKKVQVHQYTIAEKTTFENIFTVDGLLMNHVVIEPGQAFPKHPTDADVYALVVKGTLDAQLDDDDVRSITVGELLHIPKGTPSALSNGGQTVTELFVVKHDMEIQHK